MAKGEREAENSPARRGDPTTSLPAVRGDKTELNRERLAAIPPTSFPATAASTEVTARRTLFSRSGDVHSDGAAIDVLAVEQFDRLLCFLRRAHLDEGEPARFAGELVLDQIGRSDFPRLCEEVIDLAFGRVKGQIPNVQPVTIHTGFATLALSPQKEILSDLFPPIGFQNVTEEYELT